MISLQAGARLPAGAGRSWPALARRRAAHEYPRTSSTRHHRGRTDGSGRRRLTAWPALPRRRCRSARSRRTGADQRRADLAQGLAWSIKFVETVRPGKEAQPPVAGRPRLRAPGPRPGPASPAGRRPAGPGGPAQAVPLAATAAWLPPVRLTPGPGAEGARRPRRGAPRGRRTDLAAGADRGHVDIGLVLVALASAGQRPRGTAGLAGAALGVALLDVAAVEGSGQQPAVAGTAVFSSSLTRMTALMPRLRRCAQFGRRSPCRPSRPGLVRAAPCRGDAAWLAAVELQRSHAQRRRSR